MCGRVRLASDYSEIKIRLKFAPDAPAPNFEPDWNKPPTSPMLVAIRSVDGQRVPKMMRWGLLPHWAKDEKISYSTFNARSEDFTTKPAFRDAWKRGQRCLVITDGFYEWKKINAKEKQGTHPTSAVLSDARYFAKRVTLNLALRSSGDAGRGFRRVGAAAALVAG
ncbi:putative SOS response-associated peptidase YedK [Nitrobacteraceae bacterium AZCC 2146]